MLKKVQETLKNDLEDLLIKAAGNAKKKKKKKRIYTYAIETKNIIEKQKRKLQKVEKLEDNMKSLEKQ